MGSNQRRHRRSVHQAIFLAVVLVAGYFLYQTWIEARYESRRTVAQFVDASGKILGEFSLELALTPDQRAKGMMFKRRDEVRENEGMVFVFPADKAQRFWMKNTFLPLDMLFIDSALRIVGIVHSAVPLSLDERGVEASSRYVVELLGGSAKKFGIDERAKVVFEPPLPVVSE